jgi:hypothetical protein
MKGLMYFEGVSHAWICIYLYNLAVGERTDEEMKHKSKRIIVDGKKKHH